MRLNNFFLNVALKQEGWGRVSLKCREGTSRHYKEGTSRQANTGFSRLQL